MVAHFDHHQYNYNWAKTISFIIILPLIIILVEHADLVYPLVGATVYCLRNATTPSPVFDNNVDVLLSSTFPLLVSNTKSQFYFSQTRPDNSTGTEIAYAMYLCPWFVTDEDCKVCVSQSHTLHENCPNHREAITWSQHCVIKYSDRDFWSLENHEVGSTFCTKQHDYPTGRNMVQYDRKFPNFVDQLFAIAAYGDERPLRFAAAKAKISRSMTIYGFAQCTPDITGDDCMRCLRAAIAMYWKDCECKLYWPQANFPSCLLNFQRFPFY